MSPVLLVTGAAVRLGACIATRAHAQGYRVIIHHHHSADAAGALAESLNTSRPDSACALRADLADHQAIPPLVNAAADRWGRLDALVNNAAVFHASPLGRTGLEHWTGLMDVNLRAPFLLAQSAAPWLNAVRGAIVNVSDIYAERAKAGFAVYSTTKAGLSGLTRALARELAPLVRVNAVAPGAILWPETPDPEEQARLLARTPLARCGEPEDIADAVLYLLTAKYVTGQVLAVDGGRSICD